MNDAIDPRLLRLLGGQELAALRKRLRQRLLRGTAGEFRLVALSELEGAALAGLLGRRQRVSASMALNTQELDAALRHAGLAASLREALEQLDGPMVDTAAERAAVQARWNLLLADNWGERLSAWLTDTRNAALLKRLTREPDAARKVLHQAQAVLASLPAQGIPRSRLAADQLGDAHGLDPGRPVASVVLAVLRQPLNVGESSEREEEGQEGNETIRETWAAVGVLVNELARPALVLNLPIGNEGAIQTAPGEPSYLSLRQLLRSSGQWDVAGRDVYICENPNLVAIVADALGARSAPLVCTDGMPGAAQRILLRQLAEANATLHYHGDFDWAGIAIGNFAMRICGARPWRYGAEDYIAAIKEAAVPGRPLGPAIIEADWDAELGAAMRRHDQAVDEEAIASRLVSDLERVGGIQRDAIEILAAVV